jgi:hypothetical protein
MFMQSGDNYRLVVRRGPQLNATYELKNDDITLGRDITNQIVINDPEVSRHHLRLKQSTEGWTLEDLGSTNGTFINGQRISGQKMLQNGDLIGLGETVTLGYERARAANEIGAAPDAAPVAPGYAQPPAPVYSPPAAPAAAASPYEQQPAAPSYEQQGYYQQGQQDYGQGGYAAAPYGAAPGAYGQDYDPHAVRDEESRSTIRWIGIGCLVLGIFCCCTTGVSLVLIDTLNLWERLPIVKDLVPILRPIADTLF